MVLTNAILWLCVFVFLLPRAVISRSTYSSTYSAKVFSKNVTHLLDGLLAKYDKRIRPGHGGKPTTIRVNMNVRSMGPFSEKKESYSLQLYLRQEWQDSRLKFNFTDFGRSQFSMNWMFAERLWKPDTFFINGKNSYLHRITAPNMFIRLNSNGLITWSMRLTVRATCKMHLRKYPLDTQVCPLTLASYGYTAQDVMYSWDSANTVVVDPDVTLAQYISTHLSNSENTIYLNREQIPTLTVNFHLKRQSGYFILQVYVPCILIVFCSWVAFWITKKDVPGRVNLGVTTVLSITTIGFGGRATGPAVSYATALDYFVILCFAFVFAAVLEFAFINFVERAATKRRKKMMRLQQEVVERLARQMVGTASTTETARVTTSLRSALKMPLAAVPAADEEVVTVVDESPPRTEDALKTLLKVPLTVLPDTTDQISTTDKEEDPSSVKELPPEKMIRSKWRGRLENLKKRVTRNVESPPEVIVDIADEEEEEKLPPHKITLWELLMEKQKLMHTITPTSIIPGEEDMLELFSIIDIYSRRIFPSMFFLLLGIYWYLFNYYITDIVPEDKDPREVTPTV